MIVSPSGQLVAKRGWAIWINASVRSRILFPCRYGHAIFGDDVLHVCARRGHARAFGKYGHDPRERAALAVDGRAMIALRPLRAPRHA